MKSTLTKVSLYFPVNLLSRYYRIKNLHCNSYTEYIPVCILLIYSILFCCTTHNVFQFNFITTRFKNERSEYNYVTVVCFVYAIHTLFICIELFGIKVNLSIIKNILNTKCFCFMDNLLSFKYVNTTGLVSISI